LLTAVKDLFDEEEMWDRIAQCDVNQNWSATIIQNKGKLRAYFCEVAASFDLARGTDHGIEVTPGWWRRHVAEFAPQVEHFCPGCGVPARLKGHMDFEEIDTYSISNADIAQKGLKKNRKILEIDLNGPTFQPHKVTEYSEKLRELQPPPPTTMIAMEEKAPDGPGHPEMKIWRNVLGVVSLSQIRNVRQKIMGYVNFWS
jgi:hypothetical protein